MEIEQFVNELKQNCSAEGKELKPQKSAKVLHELGLIYKNRSPDKMALIQSSALFNAAIVRNSENVNVITQDLRILCDAILEVANANLCAVDLVGLSSQFKQKVTKMREETEYLLKGLTMIPLNISDQDLIAAKERKIERMINIQDMITKNYVNIMAGIAKQCETILGDPPCEYSLVGLGSLARKEITPYSDLECVILLEEGVQYRPSYEHILEYFRWFSVIFQVVLINFGETILPCVNIPGLRTFYDKEARRGICFDGMMPHACKTPLGRPYETKNKPFTLELIQPVSVMASFVDQSFDLKHGYHLADMLKTTTFIQGNLSIYNQFEEQVSQSCSRTDEADFASIYNELENNKTEFTFALLAFSGKQENSVKKIFYRTSTLFIAALGKIHNIRKCSSFEIVDTLYELGKISKIDSLNLKFAVAIACESRLKVYSNKKAQFDQTKYAVDTDGVLQLLGERSIVEYVAITSTIHNNILQKSLCFAMKSHFMLKAFYNLQLYQTAIDWNNNHLNEHEKLNDEERGVVYRYVGLCNYRVNRYDEATSYLRKALDIFTPITANPCIALFHILTCQYYLFLSHPDTISLNITGNSVNFDLLNQIYNVLYGKTIRTIDVRKSILPTSVLTESGIQKIFPYFSPMFDAVSNTTYLDIVKFIAEKIRNKNSTTVVLMKLIEIFSELTTQFKHCDTVDTITGIPECIKSWEAWDFAMHYFKPLVINFLNDEYFPEVSCITREAIVEYFSHLNDPEPITFQEIRQEFEPLLD